VFSGIPSETPLDLRFWLFGIHVRVHPLHWVIAAILGWDLTRGNLLYLALWVVCVFVSVLIHEVGHVLTGRLFGSDGRIILFSFGGVAIGASDLRERWQRILVYAAGPSIQLVLLGVVLASAYFCTPFTPIKGQAFLHDLRDLWGHLLFVAFHLTKARSLVDALFGILFLINLFWPIFNLLPIWPLDGGKIAREILEGALGHRGVIASLWLSIILAGCLAVQVLLNNYGPDRELIPYVSRWVGDSMFNALFFALFCISGFQALQAERSRSRWDEELPWER